MDENALIAAARLGDEDAFAELYRLHIGYVRGVGRAVLRQSDLDDMCQDTFLLAFTRLHSYEENSRFRSWITRIAMNRCLATLRRSRQASNGESRLLEIDAELASEDKNLEGLPARLELESLMQILEPVQRRLLELAYLEGLPEQEIAELLGMTLASVKSKIYQAKRRVRKFHKKR